MAKTTLSNKFDRYRKASLSDLKQRIIAASFGETGSAKTSFWLSAPGPIVIQSLDQGLEGVIEPFLEAGKEIYICEYESNTDALDQDAAIEQRDKFIEDFEHAVLNARTIVWDKEDQVYDLFKYAEFGAPSDNPSNYYPLFQRYRRLINLAKAGDVNFGLIQGMRTPWVPKVNKKTGAQGAAKADGQRTRRGMAEVEELVHISIEHLLEPNEDGELTFKLKIGKARGPGGRDVQNTTLDFMSFPAFATLVFPDTEESDWV